MLAPLRILAARRRLRALPRPRSCARRRLNIRETGVRSLVRSEADTAACPPACLRALLRLLRPSLALSSLSLSLRCLERTSEQTTGPRARLQLTRGSLPLQLGDLLCLKCHLHNVRTCHVLPSSTRVMPIDPAGPVRSLGSPARPRKGIGSARTRAADGARHR